MIDWCPICHEPWDRLAGCWDKECPIHEVGPGLVAMGYQIRVFLGLSREPSSDELEAARQREELAYEAYFQEIAEELKKPKKGGKKRGL